MSTKITKELFEANGLLLQESEGYYRAQGSTISKKQVSKIVETAKHCPIFSKERLSQEIEFTVVPYLPRDEAITVSPKKLWKQIESTHSLRKDDEPILIRGTQIFENPKKGSLAMNESCNKQALFIKELAEKESVPKRILDLGCGLGVNYLPFLEKGSHITAIDREEKLLESHKANPSLVLISGDITTEEYSKNTFNLVICVDVLPYIDSKQLHPLMDKIHQSLVIGGKFIGTIFVSLSKEDEIHPAKELMSKLGAHFYPGLYTPLALLKHTGFILEEYAFRNESKDLPCMEFSATKI
jgi:SAM-dependent methyltransferase